MARRLSPWEVEDRARNVELAAADRAATKARGARVWGVMAWRPDGVYRGRNVLAWRRTEAAASDLALGHRDGQGVVVRRYSAIFQPDEGSPADGGARNAVELGALIGAGADGGHATRPAPGSIPMTDPLGAMTGATV